MSDMIEVAKATVTIVPNMQGAQQAIASQLGAASSAAGSTAGTAAGTALAGGLGQKLAAAKGLMTKAIPVAAAAAVGKALYEVGQEFDEMTDTIIVGTGASGEALESLKESAKDIATTVPVSFGEAGDLVQDLNTRLGLTGDTLTEVGTQIAAVGDITGEAFDTEKFSGAMAAWGTSAEDMSGQLDTLFAVSQSTGIGMNTLTGIIETAAPQMKTLGYSFEDTAAMAGLLDKAGLDANGTMSKMSRALTALAQDGEEPAEAMQRTTAEIGKMIEKGDEAGAIDLAAELFGTRGATQFVAAVQSGSMSIDEFAAAVSDSSGIISETEQRTMSFGEHVEVLKNQFKELLEPMGSKVFEGVSAGMSVVTRVFGEFTDGPGKYVGELFNKLVNLGKRVAAVMASAFGDASGLDKMKGSTTTLTKAVSKLFSAIRPVLNVFMKLMRTVLPVLARIVGTVLGAAFRTLVRILNTVSKAVTKLKNTFDTVKKAFQKFKSVVTSPFRFLGGLKRPHIDIDGGRIPFGIGGKGEKPSISVTWGARGGILDSSTLIGIGAGEAGKEALLPLERNTGWMDTLAERINSGNTINMTVNVDGAENPEQYAQRLARELHRQVRMGAI